MADVSHTGTGAVASATGANEFLDVVWGGTVTGGMPVYIHTDGKAYAALNDTALHAAVVGFAMAAGAIGQRGQILKGGVLQLSGGMTTGLAYFCSGNAGGLAVAADVTSGKFPTVLGVAKSSTLLKIGIVAGGTAV